MFTVAAREAGWTQAGEGINAVHTGAAIKTGALRAVWSIVFTVDTTKPTGASARVAVDAVGTVGPILAWIAGALIDILLTLGTPETRKTAAEKGIDAIGAGTTTVTRVWLAVVDVSFTVVACVPGHAVAPVAARCVHTPCTIAAGALHTFIYVYFTCLTLPPCRTLA